MESALQALTEQKLLLRMEYESEKKSFTELAGRLGIRRLAERGDGWFPVTPGKVWWNSLNEKVIEIRRDGDPEEEHNFEHGRQIAFFTFHDRPGEEIEFICSATVSFAEADRMVAIIPDGVSLTGRTDIGVMLSFDETSYRAMFEALDRVMKAKGRLGELRDLILSRRKAGFLSLYPLGFPYLNKTQEEAVNKVLAAKDVAIVHGPPGTGKTTTLVEAIHETLRRESQVMVCAQSNMAVDLISERLVDRGVNVLRIGNPSRVNDKMLSFTYERRFADHPDYPDLWSLRKAMRELRGHRRGSDQWHQKMERLKSRATELEIRINNDLFSEARVIACTLVGSSSRVLEGMKFSTLFIDEAAQAMQAASWIPLKRAGRVILAGDHCQLPPTVKSFEAMKRGLGKSLMEVIVENHPEAVTLLSMQYRMNEDIMRFSSEWFYGGKMKAAPEVAHRGILDLDVAIEWIDSAEIPDAETGADDSNSFRESVAGNNYGRINVDEALLTIQTLRDYLEKIGKKRILEERVEIAVISPYRAQVRYLRSLIKSTPFFKPFRQLITVNTVDGYQGRESDVVIISLVRSNEEGRIGFLSDLRRMNVAMTRARLKLIIIGDSRTLGRHPFYKKLLTHIRTL